MISLTCTKCRATLTIDEAFAGGVCRCQHCGTIQTVPAKLKGTGPSSGAIHQAAQAGAAKALYQSRTAPPPPGSGLDELGEIIASSGLSSSRLRKPTRVKAEPAPPGTPRKTVSPALAGGAAAVVVMAAILAWLTLGNGNGADEQAAPGERPPTVAGQTVGGPNFVGIPLQGSKIVYVLDRGDSTRHAFGDVKDATLRSIATLGATRQFRIVFWDAGSIEAYPPADLAYATNDSLAAARRVLDEIYAFGATDAKAALASAMRNQPDEIVLVTAKGWDLDDEFVTMVRSVLGGAKTVVHTLSIGDPSAALQTIAKETGGQARALTAGEIRVAGK